MINIDLTPLRDGIHGAAQPSPEHIQLLLSQLGLSCPCYWLASYSHPQPSELPDLPALDMIHAEMLYFAPLSEEACREIEDAFEQENIAIGDAHYAESPGGVLGAIQQSIVSLRHKTLRQHQADDGAFHPQEIQLAKRQAIATLRQNGEMQSIELWADICLYQERNRLVSARRKLIECLASFSEHIDSNMAADHRFREIINDIQNAFAFPKLREIFLSGIHDLQKIAHEQKPYSPLVQEALRFIDMHFHEAIALQDVADALHVSTAHLSRRIKHDTGKNLTQLLHELRLSEAQRLLKETNDSVLSIALDCGFPSVEHFHRIFKRNLGSTPHQWRKQ